MAQEYMGKVILGFTMSLDGFINDRNGSVEALYPDLDTLRYSEPLKESIQNTGAVVMGRKTFAMGNPDDYAGNYEFQVPIFVLTNTTPEKHPRQTDQLTFTFMTDEIHMNIIPVLFGGGMRPFEMLGEIGRLSVPTFDFVF